jgi:hypothetical protein
MAIRQVTAVLLLAFGLAPGQGIAQSPSSTAPSAKDRERARQAAEQREREAREWKEIHRTQERMRELDEQRAEERRRQNEQWRREMDERTQRNRQSRPAQTSVPAATSPSYPSAPHAPPASTSAPRTTTSTGSQLSCSAHPVCMAAGGRSNLCMGVQSSFSGSTQSGLAEITRRCRDANRPDPCPQGARPAGPSYKLDAAPALGCADQCTKVARCASAASR